MTDVPEVLEVTEAHDLTGQSERLPWTAAMILETHFARLGRGGKGGYDPVEVDPFVKRVAGEVADLEREKDQLRLQERQLRNLLRDRDAKGFAGPSPMAVATVVAAQEQAERELDAARREYREQRAATKKMREEAAALRAEAEEVRANAEAYLQVARESGAVEAPELPPEPQPTGDLVADTEARSRHYAGCKQILDDWEAAGAERRRHEDELRVVLIGQVQRFVSELDRIEQVLPAARDRLVAVDLTDQTGETVAVGDEGERVAS